MTYAIKFSEIASTYALIPTDSHKSFWGKAEVIALKDGTKVLRSYSTYVAMIKDGIVYRTWGGWSATTGRHIKSFIGLNKKQYEALPFVEIF